MNRIYRVLAGLPMGLACRAHAATPAALIGPHTVSTAFHNFAASMAPDGRSRLFTRTGSGSPA